MPPSGGFTELFGGTTIYPAQPTYLSLPMSGDVTLEWPIETAMSGLVVADIIDVDAAAPGLSINLPDATQVTEGYTALFNNVGAQTVSVLDEAGGVLLSLVAGTVWQLYLTDNSTAAGVWRVFQFGASVSVAVAAALAGAGLKAITTTLNEKMQLFNRAGGYTILDSDRAAVQQWTGGAGAFTSPNPATVGADWFTVLLNSGTGTLTVTAAVGLINGQASLALAPGQSCWLINDGANSFTLGLGASAGGSGYSYIAIPAAGAGNLTLAGAQLNQIGYRFTGLLTGNKTITVPATTQEYWIDNQTTGAFTLTVGTAAQIGSSAGVIVPQGNQKILQCDGVNVIPGDSQAGGVALPVSIPNGGTGATTAANARTNLGGTTIGQQVFTAANAAAALGFLGAVPATRQIATTGLLQGGGDLSADRTFSPVVSLVNVQNSSNTPINVGNVATLSWDTEITDQGGWHNPAVNPSRLTVPAGVAFADIGGSLTWTGIATNNGAYCDIQIQIFKNGAQLMVFNDGMNGAGSVPFYPYGLATFSTGPLAVATGDYFEVKISSGFPANILTTSVVIDSKSCFWAKAVG